MCVRFCCFVGGFEGVGRGFMGLPVRPSICPYVVATSAINGCTDTNEMFHSYRIQPKNVQEGG